MKSQRVSRWGGSSEDRRWICSSSNSKSPPTAISSRVQMVDALAPDSAVAQARDLLSARGHRRFFGASGDESTRTETSGPGPAADPSGSCRQLGSPPSRSILDTVAGFFGISRQGLISSPRARPGSSETEVTAEPSGVQRRRALPRTASGPFLGSFTMTAPGASSTVLRGRAGGTARAICLFGGRTRAGTPVRGVMESSFFGSCSRTSVPSEVQGTKVPAVDCPRCPTRCHVHRRFGDKPQGRFHRLLRQFARAAFLVSGLSVAFANGILPSSARTHRVGLETGSPSGQATRLTAKMTWTNALESWSPATAPATRESKLRGVGRSPQEPSPGGQAAPSLRRRPQCGTSCL